MDFRVYLDGVQRIVSGVSLETTCKDIVLCLAESTQQFGKFILVERWRNNERFLNPTDSPVKILSQWGEYAPEVTFILKKCDPSLDGSAVKSSTLSNRKLQLQQQHQAQHQHPHHQQQQQLYFSHQQSRQYQSNDSANLVKRGINQSDRVEKNSTRETKKLNTSHNVNSHDHYGTCLSQTNIYHSEERLLNTPSKPSSQLVPPSSQTVIQQHPIDMDSDCNANQSLVKRPKHPPPYYEAITKSTLLRSSPSDAHEASPETSGKQWPQDEAGSSSKCSSHQKGRSLNFDSSEDSQKLNIVKINRTPENDSKPIPLKDEPRLNDAMKFSNLQKDTLESNNRHILEINSPVNYWDTNHRSSCEIQRQELIDEARRIDRMLEEQQETMVDAESDCTNEKHDEELERLNHENRQLEYDKNKLRNQLSEIENQIADCRSSIEQLMDQINQLNIQKEEDEMIKRQDEEKMKAQLIDMTNEKSIEFERQSEQLKMIDEELKESDEMLKDRIKKIEKILHELKEANLQGLSLLPREEIFAKKAPSIKTSQSHMIINPDLRNVFSIKQQRPGSTRKMFVPPRELKNAVATSKNPHGVWV